MIHENLRYSAVFYLVPDLQCRKCIRQFLNLHRFILLAEIDATIQINSTLFVILATICTVFDQRIPYLFFQRNVCRL